MKSKLWVVHLNISHPRNYCIFCGLFCIWTCNVQNKLFINSISKPFDGPWQIMAEKWNKISYDILRNSFILNPISCSQYLFSLTQCICCHHTQISLFNFVINWFRHWSRWIVIYATCSAFRKICPLQVLFKFSSNVFC